MAVALFVTYTSENELDVIGTNETIKYLATSISITDTTNQSCNEFEKTSLRSAETSLASTLDKIDVRKSQVYTMLEDLTSSTPSTDEVSANVEIIPVAAPNTTVSSTSTTPLFNDSTTISAQSTLESDEIFSSIATLHLHLHNPFCP